MKYNPRSYQEETTKLIINNPKMLVILEMGLGKTVSTLTAIESLMMDAFEVSRVLVIAPKKVADITWPEEIKKWDHTKYMTYSKMMGDEKKRLKAINTEANIYIINIDNIVWLCDYLKHHNKNIWPYDMVVIDESSTVKNPSSERFKALKKTVDAVRRTVLLTGTPAPNGLQDLWSQVYLLDKGERLGNCITRFRERYMIQNPYIHSWKMKEDVDDEIYNKISDISFVLRAKDNLTLPERIDNLVEVEMGTESIKQYKELEKNYFLQVDNDVIDCSSAAVLSNKLLQLANGFFYDEEKNGHRIHIAKIKALQDIYEEAEGKPILVFYWFKEDLASLKSNFNGAVELKGQKEVEDWNAGKIKMLLAHPASAGHGLNLQYGGNIAVWYSLTWSLECYEQACARLHRQGQINTTVIHHLVCKDTIDEDIMSRLSTKQLTQNDLKEAIIERRKQYIQEN